jgi:hypothetical protein
MSPSQYLLHAEPVLPSTDLQTTASFTMPTHGHGHRRHVGGLIVTLPVGDANGRPATRATGGAAAPLPLLGALGRLRCGSACPRQPGSSMKGVGLVGELVTPRGRSRGRKLPSGRRHREPRGRLR